MATLNSMMVFGCVHLGLTLPRCTRLPLVKSILRTGGRYRSTPELGAWIRLISRRNCGVTFTKAKCLDPGVATGNHNHLFDTRLLVLEGEIIITCDGQQRTYGAREVLEIERGVEHSERYGAGRFEFVVGLRHEAAGHD